MKHKHGCKMSGLDVEIVSYNCASNDPSLCISERGVKYSSNIHTKNANDWEIDFMFCPVCGATKARGK